jgi:hypothetical protein
MISHFVNKDARNWDKYVPYAVMAYRAIPHCSVKYSPYYLVYGRELRLPIEDDWKPKWQEQGGKKGDYEEHVSELAMRLCEAIKAAKKQSKLSHELAKKYYDKKAREIQLKKGDFMYLYNPIAKRGRAKKFQYKYQGPYTILEKISPLIYRLQMEENRSIVVHVNRLKRAYEGSRVSKKALEQESGDQKLPRQCEPQPDIIDNNLQEEERKEEIPPVRLNAGEQNDIRDTDDESIEGSPTLEDQRHPEWTPGTRYLRRKITREASRSPRSTHDIPYALRSRAIGTQLSENRSEPSNMSLQVAEDLRDLSENYSVEPNASSDAPSKHPYNLRSRTQTT